MISQQHTKQIFNFLYIISRFPTSTVKFKLGRLISLRFIVLLDVALNYFIINNNNDNNNNNNNNQADKQAWERVVALCLRWLSRSDPLYGL